VRATVINRSRRTFLIGRPHRPPSETEFGIAVGNVEFFATRFSPRLPLALAPGARWSGAFFGSRRLPVSGVRIVFGRFTA
jgi:hypothetical protein